MVIYHSRRTPVIEELARVDPKMVNHGLLLEVVKIVVPFMERVLPEKRSGYQYDAHLFVQLYCELTGLAHGKGTDYLESIFEAAGLSFQQVPTQVFENGKKRRTVPDQPAMSRFLTSLRETGKVEEFGNLVYLALFLYVQKQDFLSPELTLIADYIEEDCQKDLKDPYCFGTRKGKTKHKTLAFSVTCGNLHQVVATFAIYKRQDKLPLFEQVVANLRALGLTIKYALLDRGFYRKRLLWAFRQWGITVIVPGRGSSQTRRKVHLWLRGKGGRRVRFKMKLGSIKKWGQKFLTMDMVLMAKRGYPLAGTRRDYKVGKLTLEKAARQIFPLLVSRGSSRGISKIAGNEYYIRDLYRRRWAIEIAFREVHRLGIANWVQDRSKRLFRFNCKCVVYNLWQVERKKLQSRDPGTEALTLDEFCGKLLRNRSRVKLLKTRPGVSVNC